MRAFQILRENTSQQFYHDDSEDVSAEKVRDFIMTNCQPWMKATKNGEMIVFRGGAYLGEIFIKDTREDRKPKDSSLKKHEAFNDILKVAGSPANRSNSMFVTGSYGEAFEFGRPYVCFPIGEFNYAWSPVWRDWTRQLHSRQIKELLLKPEVADSIDDLYTLWQVIKDPNNFDMKKVHEAIVVNSRLHEAIKVEHEIMIQCKSALYVRHNIVSDIFYTTWVNA